MQLMYVCLFAFFSFSLLWSADDNGVVVTSINDSDSFCQAIRNNELENVRAYLGENKDVVNANDIAGSLPLLYAAYIGSLDMTALLLENGAKVNSWGYIASQFITPLGIAISRIAKEDDVHHERMQVMNLLLMRGAIPGVHRYQNNTHGSSIDATIWPLVRMTNIWPLVRTTNPAVATVLHRYGADIDEKINLVTPLMRHVQRYNKEMLYCLLQQGACVDKVDENRNALSAARTLWFHANEYDSVHAMGRWLLQVGTSILDIPEQEKQPNFCTTSHEGGPLTRYEGEWQGYAYDKTLSDYIAKFPRVRCLRNMALDVIRVHAPKDIELSEQADLLWRDMFQYKDEVEDDPSKWTQGYAPLQLPYGFAPHPEQQKEPSCN